MIYQTLTIRRCAFFATFTAPVAVVVGALLFFSNLLSEVAAKAIPAALWGYLLLLSILKYTPQLLMLSAFLGVFLAMRRFFRHYEMEAWFSAGLGMRHFLVPILMFILPIASFVAVFSLVVSPWAVRSTYFANATAIFSADLQQLSRNTFVQLPGGTHTAFWGDDGTLFLSRVGHLAGRHEVIFAKEVERRSPRDFSLLEGRLFHLDEQNPEPVLEELVFDTLEVSLPSLEAVPLPSRAKSPADLSWQNPAERAELIWRINLPIATIFMAIAALFLAAERPRSSRQRGYLLSLALFFLTLNVMRYFKSLMADSVINAPLALVLPPLFVVIVTGFAYQLARPR